MPFVKEVLHRYKVADTVLGVDVIHDGDIANAHTVKFFFHQGSDYQAVTSETGMVFDDQRSNFAFLSEFHYLVEGGTVKVCTGETIIYKQSGVLEAVISCVAL